MGGWVKKTKATGAMSLKDVAAVAGEGVVRDSGRGCAADDWGRSLTLTLMMLAASEGADAVALVGCHEGGSGLAVGEGEEG